MSPVRGAPISPETWMTKRAEILAVEGRVLCTRGLVLSITTLRLVIG